MAQKTIQNSFASGMLSPELHGRSDLAAYSAGAADLHNFVVRRSGGIRKRPGTTHLLSVATGSSDSLRARAFPYVFDRETSGIVLIEVRTATVGEATTTAATATLHLWTHDAHVASAATTVVTDRIADASSLDAFRSIQIGDTLFFTATGGLKSFRCAVTAATATMEFSDIEVNEAVAIPANIAVAATGFAAAGSGFFAATKIYAVYGVKDGIYSAPITRAASLTLPWQAGAKVTVTWTPDWEKHDQYVVGKMVGANFGKLGDVFATNQDAVFTDLAELAQDQWDIETTPTLNGVVYLAASNTNTAIQSNPQTEAKTGDGLSKYHPSGLVTSGYNYFTYAASASFSAIKLWIGAKLRRNAAQNTVDEVGVPSLTTGNQQTYISIQRYTGSAWTTLARVLADLSYHADHITIPIAGTWSSASYYVINVTDSGGNPSAGTKWVLRGMLPLATSDATCTFIDDNIVPSVMVPTQEKLVVGDDGMDCRVASVWEQRLMFASSPEKPFSLWFSMVGNLYAFAAARPQADSDAFTVSIPAIRASAILHASAGKWLMLFTENGVYQVSNNSEGFTHRTITINRVTSAAAHPDVAPVEIDGSVIMVADDGRTVLEITYDMANDSLVPIDRSVLSSSLTEGSRIVKAIHQRHPDSIVWFLLDDGTLAAMTFMPEHKVYAWSRHTLGDAGGAWKAVDILLGGSTHDADGREPTSVVYVVLQATSGGAIASYEIERMASHTASDAPSAASAALEDHKGSAHASAVGASLTTLPPENPELPLHGRQKAVIDSLVRVRRTRTLSVAPAAQPTLAPIVFGSPDLAQGGAVVALESADWKIAPRGYFNDKGQVTISDASRWPCEILAVQATLEVTP